MAEAMNLLLTAFTQCVNWFGTIMAQSGGANYWITAFLVFLSYRFILYPLFGQAHSDTVESTYKNIKNSYRNSGSGKFSPGNRAKKYGSGKNGGRFERK